jgi:hypothetical protein
MGTKNEQQTNKQITRTTNRTRNNNNNGTITNE